MENKIHLSVVIPSYNEEKRITATLLDLDKYFSEQDYTYEIIVVNDGSKDNTATVVNKTGELIKNLRLIDNKENHGKGYVTRQGMLEAKGEYCMYIDADNAISINQIENLWPHTKDYDVVIGSIEVRGAKIEENAGWYRRLFGKLSKYLIRIVAGIWEIKDTQRAFKIFRADTVKNIYSRLKINRWLFDVEVLVIAKKLGYTIKEVPVTWINPGGGTLTLKSYIRSLGDLVKIKYNLITNKYGLKK